MEIRYWTSFARARRPMGLENVPKSQSERPWNPNWARSTAQDRQTHRSDGTAYRNACHRNHTQASVCRQGQRATFGSNHEASPAAGRHRAHLMRNAYKGTTTAADYSEKMTQIILIIWGFSLTPNHPPGKPPVSQHPIINSIIIEVIN